jgi:dynein heavy chain
LDSLVRHHHHCLFVGPTGTGKTVYVKKHLQTGLPQDEFVSLIVTFSAQTMSNMTQVRSPHSSPVGMRQHAGMPQELHVQHGHGGRIDGMQECEKGEQHLMQSQAWVAFPSR